MRLIFIYGPPAAGKLTVGEKLSELTGIPLFHNHLTRDIVMDIYGEDLGQHYDLVDKLRHDVLEYCAKKGTDIIFTVVYAGPEDDNSVREYIDIIESNGGEVVFVELMASPEDLIGRVNNETRTRFKKLDDPEIMKEIVQNLENYSIPFVKKLKINTSELKATESAIKIAKELSLGGQNL